MTGAIGAPRGGVTEVFGRFRTKLMVYAFVLVLIAIWWVRRCARRGLLPFRFDLHPPSTQPPVIPQDITDTSDPRHAHPLDDGHGHSHSDGSDAGGSHHHHHHHHSHDVDTSSGGHSHDTGGGFDAGVGGGDSGGSSTD